ncbi:4-hydroxy-tetrahydrodipicolinate reductase [Mangrovicella endophytica]|uniref:4-hydroxy-tetrahydrodipicolinate reductase n=1 Tax=Mangrovicella endophytica TaxID=2066697 RepID=UPI000C9DC0B7|nr:4-hydroxy-tetrahydrodipicolinate reductase [Mangrovicella endophytica]
MDAMKLVVLGASGRMGRMLISTIAATPGVVLQGAVERPGAADCGRDAGELVGTARTGVIVTDDLGSALQSAHGVIDFTAPATSRSVAERAAAAGVVHIIGTTGLSADDRAAIAAAARAVPIVQSGNMSLGVNLLAVLVEKAAAALGPDAFDIEILEMHHRHKVDAPSGTALLLGEAAATGRGVELDGASVRVRDGHTGARTPGTIGFATLRGGSVVGDHSVILAGEGETIEFTHRASDRSIFARGALRAALWARAQPPGLYSMRDVLGL